MGEDINELLQSFKKLLLKNFGNQLAQLVLYGSRAVGNAQESSDVDIAGILNCTVDWHTKQRVYDLAFEAEGDTGKLINVIVFSKSEYESRAIESLLLIESIKERGVPV